MSKVSYGRSYLLGSISIVALISGTLSAAQAKQIDRRYGTLIVESCQKTGNGKCREGEYSGIDSECFHTCKNIMDSKELTAKEKEAFAALSGNRCAVQVNVLSSDKTSVTMIEPEGPLKGITGFLEKQIVAKRTNENPYSQFTLGALGNTKNLEGKSRAISAIVTLGTNPNGTETQAKQFDIIQDFDVGYDRFKDTTRHGYTRFRCKDLGEPRAQGSGSSSSSPGGPAAGKVGNQ